MKKQKTEKQAKPEPEPEQSKPDNGFTGCFLKAGEHYGPEHRVVELIAEYEKFPYFDEELKKLKPYQQCLIDTDRIYRKVDNMADFISAVEDILPFWLKNTTTHRLYETEARRMTFYLHQRASQLRAEYYTNGGTIDFRPMPNNLLEIENWLTDTKRAFQGNRNNQSDNTGDSMPLGQINWADIFHVSTNTVRNWIRNEDENRQYHFKQVSARKWVLPKSDIPVEYLANYSKQLEKITIRRAK